jgi:hypothetical protein
MSISVICTLQLTEEELLFLLQLRAGEFLVPPPEETKAAAKGNETPTSVSVPSTPNVTFNSPKPVEPETTINSPTDYANTPRPEVIPVEPPPLPPKPTRSRAKTTLSVEEPINATPLAPAPPPPPEPLDEPAMRSLLSKVGAVHPLKVKAITNILEEHGGKRRLSECDPVTWPTIAEEAQKILAEYGA